MDAFTCVTCRLVFQGLDEQKIHYRTAWHCFNLKRKVANLAPVSEDVFDVKIAELKERKLQTSSKKKNNTYAKSKNQQEQNPSKKTHKGQKKGKTNVNLSTNDTIAAELISSTQSTIIDPPSDANTELSVQGSASTEKTEEELIEERLANAVPVPTKESLFDGTKSKDLESNLNSMRVKYGFFIPAIEHLHDAEGLLAYLGEKVGIGYCCVWCAKEFNSLSAVRNHMIDKSHAKMSFYGYEDEYADYYDLSKLGFVETSRVGGEDVNNQSIVLVGDSTEGREVALYEERPSTWKESEVTGELILPSGVSLGHRSLQKYYKQRVKPEETRPSVLIGRLQSQYRELGLKEEKKVERIAERRRRVYIHTQQKDSMQIGVKANKFQKHFRAQVEV